jgi:hypothetical protein
MPVEDAEETIPEEKADNRNIYRRKKNKPTGERPQQEKPQQPAQEGGAEGAKPKGKPHHRRRRPNKKPE